jgi:SAM-dependent methyltransferase
MTNPIPDDRSHAGQAIYTRTTLSLYDFAVLGISNSLIWRCPTRRILDLYDLNVSEYHLDVGVGTGWYLDHCRFPVARPRIALLDLNPHSLRAASDRIARYVPQQYRADVLRPIGLPIPPVRSIAFTYLLHCLPGTMTKKAVALDHALPLLEPDGVLFGATLLASGVHRSAAAKRLMAFYNRKGIFSNKSDGPEGLRNELERRFAHVEINVVGCGALFTARGPRRSR